MAPKNQVEKFEMAPRSKSSVSARADGRALKAESEQLFVAVPSPPAQPGVTILASFRDDQEGVAFAANILEALNASGMLGAAMDEFNRRRVMDALARGGNRG